MGRARWGAPLSRLLSVLARRAMVPAHSPLPPALGEWSWPRRSPCPRRGVGGCCTHINAQSCALPLPSPALPHQQ